MKITLPDVHVFSSSSNLSEKRYAVQHLVETAG